VGKSLLKICQHSSQQVVSVDQVHLKRTEKEVPTGPRVHLKDKLKIGKYFFLAEVEQE
jgi:hypothetical protein